MHDQCWHFNYEHKLIMTKCDFQTKNQLKSVLCLKNSFKMTKYDFQTKNQLKSVLCLKTPFKMPKCDFQANNQTQNKKEKTLV